MTTENSDEQIENASKEEKKVIARYNESLNLITAIVKGEKNLLAQKLNSAEISNLVDEMFKEEKEALSKEIKADIKEAMKAHLTYRSARKQLAEDFKKKDLEKMKEFSIVVGKINKKIENLHDITKQYSASLKAITGNSLNSITENSENSENSLAEDEKTEQ